MRVLLDANIFISHIINPQRSGTIQSIIKAFKQGKFALVMPDNLFKEIATVVTQRPHLAKIIDKAQATEMQEVITSMAEMLPPIREPFPAVVRDRKDDYLIAYAVVGEVDYLVTGDDDLLVLKKVDTVRIVSPAEFARLLQ